MAWAELGGIVAERVIDLLVNPFTPEMRTGPYGTTPDMRDALTKLGVFEHPHTADQLVAQVDAAGVEKALIPASSWGVANVPMSSPSWSPHIPTGRGFERREYALVRSEYTAEMACLQGFLGDAYGRRLHWAFR